MARKQKSVKPKSVSVYTLLDKWLFDGSKTSPIPKEVVNDKKIGPNHLLYFFSGTQHGVYISKYFNNFGIYQLDRLEVFGMIKDIVQKTAYVPKWKKRFHETRSKIFKELWRKYPYLKPDDINLLADNLEKMDCRDTVFEMFGIEKPKMIKEKKSTPKDKPTKVGKTKIRNPNSMEAVLENFDIVKE